MADTAHLLQCARLKLQDPTLHWKRGSDYSEDTGPSSPGIDGMP